MKIAQRGGNASILVDEADSPTRKRFTIAHAPGHHFLHLMGLEGEFVDTDVDFFRDYDPADLFASALLMPRELVTEGYRRNPRLADLGCSLSLW